MQHTTQRSQGCVTPLTKLDVHANLYHAIDLATLVVGVFAVPDTLLRRRRPRITCFFTLDHHEIVCIERAPRSALDFEYNVIGNAAAPVVFLNDIVPFLFPEKPPKDCCGSSPVSSLV